MSHPPARDLVQQRYFGRYEILESLGSGGMGEVYRARDLSLGRPLAIKVLHTLSATDPEQLARFEQEARAASALNHPNIVTIYEIGEIEGTRYIAMELVEGRTLRSLLPGGLLLTRRTLQLAAQAADGLAQAHAAGIVHRDLKPENIMVTRDGRVKILDFGLAKLIPPVVSEEAETGSFQSPSTEPGRLLGTVGYMSPEQARGEVLDFRSDQFSCGAILYEMVTGKPAFLRPSGVQTMAAIIEDEPEPISSLNPSVPAPLRWIVERCLAKEPAERYASTRDLARDLANVLDHFDEVSSSPRHPPLPPAPRPAPLRFAALRLAALAAAGLAVVLAATLWLAPPGPQGGGVRSGPGTPLRGRRSVAVLGFRNLSGQTEAAWLSTALAEMLTTELAAGGHLRTIPGENVGRMKMELSLSDTESLAADTLRGVARNLGTDMVLLGSYLTLPGDQLRLDLRLQDAAAGDTVVALAESGTQAGLIDLVTRTGARLRQSMGVEELEPEASGLTAGAPSNLEAQRLHAQGLARLRVLDALTARDLLQKAVAADARSPMAHLALADAWTSLGYDAKAKEETQRAFDLSAQLSREERLSVEGRHREASGEWGRALEIYGALLAFYPDNVEYGLRLASAQSAAGRGREALDTLARLRGLPPPAPEDPRIDLTEAAIVESLGDYKGELAAARRAIAKGTAQGARLLVARARLREAYALDRLGEIPRATVAAQEARAIYTQAGDQGGLARALNAIGSLHWNHGDLEKVRTTWEEALEIRRQMGYRHGVAASQHNLGLVLWEQGDLDGARRHLEEGLAIDRELGLRSEIATDLEALAGLYFELGDLERARKTGEQALAACRKVGDETEAALSLLRLGALHQAEGELEAAEVRFREALPILEEKGTRDLVADAHFLIGELQKARGDLPAARKSHEAALAIRDDLRAAFAMAKSQFALGSLANEEGRPEAAEPLLRKAIEVFAAQKSADWEAASHAALARMLLARDQAPESRRAVERATALSGRSRSPHVRLAIAATTGLVHASQGRVADAVLGLEAALAEARRLRLLGLQLELRLVRGQVQGASGRGPSSDLASLAREARNQGFGLLAGKAEALLRPATAGAGRER